MVITSPKKNRRALCKHEWLQSEARPKRAVPCSEMSTSLDFSLGERPFPTEKELKEATPSMREMSMSTLELSGWIRGDVALVTDKMNGRGGDVSGPAYILRINAAKCSSSHIF